MAANFLAKPWSRAEDELLGRCFDQCDGILARGAKKAIGLGLKRTLPASVQRLKHIRHNQLTDSAEGGLPSVVSAGGHDPLLEALKRKHG